MCSPVLSSVLQCSPVLSSSLQCSPEPSSDLESTGEHWRALDKNEEETTREGTIIGCELGVLFGRLGILSSQIISSSFILSSLLFSSFILTCLLFSSLLLSSLIVASVYSLLFLSSFRLWGVFHRLSLRSPPLTDPVLPYLSLSHWRVSFFLFLFFIFLFFNLKNKTKNQL